jgi:hypothetical protein
MHQTHLLLIFLPSMYIRSFIFRIDPLGIREAIYSNYLTLYPFLVSIRLIHLNGLMEYLMGGFNQIRFPTMFSC